MSVAQPMPAIEVIMHQLNKCRANTGKYTTVQEKCKPRQEVLSHCVRVLSQSITKHDA
jgi:hypothetical protein